MAAEFCRHAGRVRPVVWQMTPDGEIPNTVMCEQCWHAVSAIAVAYASYSEDKDGWYVPDKPEVEI